MGVMDSVMAFLQSLQGLPAYALLFAVLAGSGFGLPVNEDVYFALYCPPGYDHFCAEPVSQCTDWLNLLQAAGHPALGGARVAPGRSLRPASR